MTKLTDEAVKAMLDGATPGPWAMETVRTSCGTCHRIGPFPRPAYASKSEGWACVYDDYPPGVGSPDLLANSRLIAVAPDLARALLDARAELARVKVDAQAAHEGGMDAAADKILDWLANAVGAKEYTTCDGSETWDGDVQGTIYAILKAGNVYDDEDGRVAKLADAQAAVARGMERAAEICAGLADQVSDAVLTGLPEQARLRESMEAAFTKARHAIRAEAALTKVARLGQEWDAATATEYERKVAQMKEDFPNGI